MLHFTKSLPMNKNLHTSWRANGEYIFSKCKFLDDISLTYNAHLCNFATVQTEKQRPIKGQAWTETPNRSYDGWADSNAITCTTHKNSRDETEGPCDRVQMDYWSLFSVLDFRLCLVLTSKDQLQSCSGCGFHRPLSLLLILEETHKWVNCAVLYIYISCLWDKINIFKSFRKEVNMRIIALMGDALPFKSLLNAIIYLIKKSKKKKT